MCWFEGHYDPFTSDLIDISVELAKYVFIGSWFMRIVNTQNKVGERDYLKSYLKHTQKPRLVFPKV